MVKKAHFLLSISSCAFLLCSCNLLDFLKPKEKHEHNYVLVNAKEASFYEDGNSEYYVCSDCNKTFDLNKNEKNINEFLTRIPLFDLLDRKDPISLKGMDIPLNFNETEVQTNITQGNSLVEKINSKNYVPTDIQPWSTKNNQLRSSTMTNYYYSDVLADFNGDEVGYETKNKIYNAYYDLQDIYYAVYVAVAKEGSYNNIFFKSYTQEQIEEFIAKHSPSGGGGGGGTPSISQQMENILNNYKAGKIDRYSAYSQYVELAKQLASSKSKESYLHYAYGQFGREYTVAQADQLSSLVKTYIKPLAVTFKTKLNEAKNSASNSEGSNNLNNNFFGEKIDLLRDYSKNLGDPYKTNFQNLFEGGHYFFSSNTNKNVTAYTANSPALGRYIFLGKNNQDIMAITHEFGHYNAEEVYGDVGDLDLSEIQSKGNEILLLSFMKNYQNIDENIVKTFTYQHLSEVTNNILLGCAINEFEKYVYTNTFDQTTMENKWLEIVDDYGANITRNKLDYLYQVVLNYRGYYISYAVSGIASLELYQKGIEDFELAAESYKSIYTKDSENEKFTLSLQNAQLGNVFDANSYSKISQLGNI